MISAEAFDDIRVSRADLVEKKEPETTEDADAATDTVAPPQLTPDEQPKTDTSAADDSPKPAADAPDTKPAADAPDAKPAEDTPDAKPSDESGEKKPGAPEADDAEKTDESAAQRNACRRQTGTGRSAGARIACGTTSGLIRSSKDRSERRAAKFAGRRSAN